MKSLVSMADDDRDDYFFSRIDYQQGLSNSAVMCLFQDNTGLMWFGTYDGVNCWDGKTMEVFRSDFSNSRTLSSNIVHGIAQADDNCLWLMTHLGVNRFSSEARQVVGSYEKSERYNIFSNAKGNTWVINDSRLLYYNTLHQRFIRFRQVSFPTTDLRLRSFATEDGTLWVFPHGPGNLCKYSLNSFHADSLKVKLSVTTTNFHSKPIEDIYYQNGVICFIDSDKDLYMYDISRKSKIYIRNIATLMQQYGSIEGIVSFYDDILVGFLGNGLIRLRASEKYKDEIINQNIRIYGLYRDPHLGMLWIASDGQGAVMYGKRHSVANNLMLSRLSPNLSRQVRSILTDEHGGLWFGTKGDGLIHVPNYRELGKEGLKGAAVYVPGAKQSVASYVKWTKEFQVYCLRHSRYSNGFWVGASEPGLYFYSFDDDALHPVESALKDVLPRDVHALYEAGDSILYVATGSNGFHKLWIERHGARMRVIRQKSYGFQNLLIFYSMLVDGDILWLGSRQKGLVRFDMRTEEYQVISLKRMLHKPVDDILCLCRTHDGKIYLGTASGLVRFSVRGKEMSATYVGRDQGLLNDMIHGVLEDANGFLWLSTNRGLVKYNPKNGLSHCYYYSGGVRIGEFSDDAYYQCPYTGYLFFGGIDGLLYFDRKITSVSEYYPNVLLRRLWIGHEQVNLAEHYERNGDLRIKGSDGTFSLVVAVPDFLNYEDVEYSFMLEGYDKKWSTFGSSSEATYLDVPPGHYVFKVRYRKDVFDTEYRYFSFPVHVIPPFYRSVWAWIFYLLVAGALVVFIFRLCRRYMLHERILRRLLNSEHTKETSVVSIYNDRRLLDAFTLIYYACDQLRAENLTNEQRLHDVALIRETVMATLFRPDILSSERLSHFYPTMFVLAARMCIQELSCEVLRVLQASGTDVSLIRSAIDENYTFPVYKNALRCILYYCYYTLCQDSSAQVVSVEAADEEDKMCLTFTTSDNRLSELYDQLKGTVCPVYNKKQRVDQAFGNQQMLCFVQAALERLHVEFRKGLSGSGLQSLSLLFKPAPLSEETMAGSKKTILFLENREDWVWLITGLLSDEYDVRVVKSVQVAFEELSRTTPAVFLVDMSMYAHEEGTFMEYVANNRNLLSKMTFVPILTWEVSSSIHQELIKWSDVYIVAPYDIPFLKEMLHKAIYGKREPKQIYLDNLGGLEGLIVCTTPEQAEFAHKLLRIIEKNLGQEDLGSNFIADRMAMSSRQFYRKFKEISQIAPGDFIKNFRMEKAVRLLREGELSIQDIIADVGISSRAYFYKEFAKKYGMTPKDYREQQQKTDGE